ncbi:MAG: glycine--tRNA ligase subunit beta [Gammaproteobacteria bacterium]
MAETKPFLVEIGTEELPPKSLKNLAEAFHYGILSGLEDAKLFIPPVPVIQGERYFSPRRLALYLPKILLKQKDRIEERLGPAVSAAFDQQGEPTKTAEGFARSCGVTVGQLQRRVTEKGERLAYALKLKGKPAADLLPQIVAEALAKLPIPKRMRWGAGEAKFVRPVHWVVMLFGERTLKATILGVAAGNKTYGHRFHHPRAIVIKHPAEYRKLLEKTGRVLVEDARGSLKTKIKALVEREAAKLKGRAQLDEALLEEVASLVEWPVPVAGSFDNKFLALPDEVIVAVLETQQRYFPLRQKNGTLLPYFVTLANIKSKQPQEICRGNERVIGPRLADAMFFWSTDRAQRLDSRIEELDRVTFQKELGSIGDKSHRVTKLAKNIAQDIGSNPALAERAAKLAKCDLLTGMVGEFPELQGIMGGYYAQHDGETAEVCAAIAEQYLPRFAGDALPKTLTGQALAIADKLDTITGIFAIGQKPTGDKDPFALRRAGLGLLRIIIECRLDLDLVELVRAALANQNIQGKLEQHLLTGVVEFLLERLRAYYLETGIRADVFEAVRAKNPARPLDFHARIQAVNAFLTLPEAASLAAANKRIANILRQAGGKPAHDVQPRTLREPAEQSLHENVIRLRRDIRPLVAKGDYTNTLRKLAALRVPVDQFFDKVLVMDPDIELRTNRLALLARLSALFLDTADLSLIQVD